MAAVQGRPLNHAPPPPAGLGTAARAAGARFLAGLDDDWARHIHATGACTLATFPAREPWEALARAVAHQQLHGRAAEAILGRLIALWPGQAFPTAMQLASTAPETLRACGFSTAKCTALLALAAAAVDGRIPDRAEAVHLDEETLVGHYTALPGIGRWTVEMMLIQTPERPDVLPAADLGIREGWRRLKGLERAPTPAALRRIGEAWAPWRSLAAWYLWQVPA